jgi:hypothetical protein
MASDSKVLKMMEKVQLKAWSAPRAHNRRLALCVRDLLLARQVISDLYHLEKGNSPELYMQYTLAKISEKECQYILLIQNMHNFYPLDCWLQDPKNYRVFYHHSTPAAGEPLPPPGLATMHSMADSLTGDAFYIAWGQELADPVIEDEVCVQAAAESALVLAGKTLKGTYLVESPRGSHSILDLIDLAKGVRVAHAQDAAPSYQQAPKSPDSKNPLLAIELGLYGLYQREVIPPYKINALEELIEDLQFQVSLLKNKQDFQACEVYAYEETASPASINELQAFLLNTPFDVLRQYRYRRIALDLEGREHIYHLLGPAREDTAGSAELRYPPNPACRFYRHPVWSDHHFYLPVDLSTGRRMDFYPPLRYGESADSVNIEPVQKILRAMLGGHQTRAGERVFFWPYPETVSEMRTVYCVAVSDWVPLAGDSPGEQSIWNQLSFRSIQAGRLSESPNLDDLVFPILAAVEPQLSLVEGPLNEKVSQKCTAMEQDYRSFQAESAKLETQIQGLKEQFASAMSRVDVLKNGITRLDQRSSSGWDALYQSVQEIQSSLGKTVVEVLETAAKTRGRVKTGANDRLARLMYGTAGHLTRMANSLAERDQKD